MATTVVVGHTITYKIEYVDTNGAPMLATVTPDSPPVWSDTPSSPPVDTFTPAADGNSAVLVATGAGSDTVTATAIVAGVSYTASDLVTIQPAPQQLGGIVLVATVS